MDQIRTMEAEQIREGREDFKVGDTVRVHYRIVEGRTERIQVFEGLCIAKKGDSLKKTFKLRKMSYGVGVERTFPLHSPRIQKIEVARRGRTRRAKLYYIRDRVGKATKVAELLRKKTRPAQAAEVRVEVGANDQSSAQVEDQASEQNS